jgi:hypothetical protein
MTGSVGGYCKVAVPRHVPGLTLDILLFCKLSSTDIYTDYSSLLIRINMKIEGRTFVISGGYVPLPKMWEARSTDVRIFAARQVSAEHV